MLESTMELDKYTGQQPFKKNERVMNVPPVPIATIDWIIFKAINVRLYL